MYLHCFVRIVCISYFFICEDGEFIFKNDEWKFNKETYLLDLIKSVFLRNNHLIFCFCWELSGFSFFHLYMLSIIIIFQKLHIQYYETFILVGANDSAKKYLYKICISALKNNYLDTGYFFWITNINDKFIILRVFHFSIIPLEYCVFCYF